MGTKFSDNNKVTHLVFVNDFLLCGNGTTKEARVYASILRTFFHEWEWN